MVSVYHWVYEVQCSLHAMFVDETVPWLRVKRLRWIEVTLNFQKIPVCDNPSWAQNRALVEVGSFTLAGMFVKLHHINHINAYYYYILLLLLLINYYYHYLLLFYYYYCYYYYYYSISIYYIIIDN